MDFVASQFEARSEPLLRQDNVSAACADAGARVDVEGRRRSGAQRRPPMAFLVNIVITALRKKNTLLLRGGANTKSEKNPS